MQDIIGTNFNTYGTVITFSWLSADFRRQGLGREMREAALHLSFEGFGAIEAASEAFLDNAGSNRVSETLGYERNGTTWATRRGHPGLLQRWRITREHGCQDGATTSQSRESRPADRPFRKHPDLAPLCDGPIDRQGGWAAG
jgi:hypothetical protein